MGDSSVWSVDVLAARSLLLALKLDVPDETVDLVAKRFSAHRNNSYKWAAQRIYVKTVESLEEVSKQEFCHKDERWTQGFQFAQQCVLAHAPEASLELETRKARTKGQVLRSLIRSEKAKRQ